MKALKILSTVFLIIALILGGITTILYTETGKFINASRQTRGEVISLSRSSSSGGSEYDSRVWYPVVRFVTAEGDTVIFFGRTGSNPPAFRTGELVAVRYNPAKPQAARIDTFFSLHLADVITGGLSVFFLIPALVMLLIMGRRRRLDAWLDREGQLVTAEMIQVGLNRAVRVNGRNPYRIVCQWHDPAGNQIVTFYSRNIWFNPEKYIQSKSIQVKVDPRNYRRYRVDTGFLPREG